jgi:hypothetical protein
MTKLLKELFVFCVLSGLLRLVYPAGEPLINFVIVVLVMWVFNIVVNARKGATP